MNRAKFYTSVVLTVFLLFGMTVPAHAITTLTSSPLFITSFGLTILCAIANVGPHPITVTVAVIHSDGDVLSSLQRTVDPGATFALNFPFSLPDASVHGYYCKFTGNFNRGFVRANAQVFDNAQTIAVVPAQAVGE